MDKALTLELHNEDAIKFIQSRKAETVDLLFTDPPYNISKQGVFFRDYRSGRNGDIKRDFGSWDYNYDPAYLIEETKRVLNDDGQIVIWTSEQLYGTYRELIEKNGMFPKQMLIWIKENPAPQFRLMGYRQTEELMIWATKKPLTRKNPNFIFGTQEEMKNVFFAPIVSGHERLEHPTQKPLSVCEWVINHHVRPYGTVLDPYFGSGTILDASLRMERNVIGTELDKKYVEMARDRLHWYYESHSPDGISHNVGDFEETV